MAFTHDVRFNTYGDALEFASLKPKRDSRSYSRDLGQRDDTWSKTVDYADMYDNFGVTGWNEGADMIAPLADALTDNLCSMVAKPVMLWDVEGDCCDVALALTGVPEYMMRYDSVLQETDGNVVRIMAHIGASSNVSADVMIARGVVLAALVQLLELAGKRAEVSTLWTSDAYACITTMIKTADQPLDMPRLAFALAHPAYVRRVMFGCVEQYPEGLSSNYGCPVNVTKDRRGDIYAPALFSADSGCDWQDADSVREYLLSALRLQGVTVTLE